VREISIDRMSQKDGYAEQTQDCRDRFDHFDAPFLRTVYAIADVGFGPASSARQNGFVGGPAPGFPIACRANFVGRKFG
jgi:hypothetical protein